MPVTPHTDPVFGPYTVHAGRYATAVVTSAGGGGTEVDFASDFTASGGAVDISASRLNMLRLINNSTAAVLVEFDGTGDSVRIPGGGAIDFPGFHTSIGVVLTTETSNADVYLAATW